MSDQNIDRIIFLYLSGEANLEEIQLLRKWINSNPANKEVFENISGHWNNSKIEISSSDKDELYSELLRKIENQNDNHRSVFLKTPQKTNFFNTFFLKIAAAIVLLAVLAFVINHAYNDQTPPIRKEVSLIVKQNPAGQKSTIRLPDGSTVWLNAESSISFPENFNDSLRVVTLSGEAFFDVTKDKARPFIVDADEINIAVLGTKFNVKAFPEDGRADVSLVSGRVELSDFKNHASEIEPLFLEPGEAVQYNSQSGVLQKGGFDLIEATAWKDGILVLKNDSFDSFINKLERWYGVKVKVLGQPGKKFIVTGRFQNENMENVLRALQYGRDFEFVTEGDILTLKFNNM